MKVTVKTVSDRITMLEAQQTLSLNEESTLNTYRWALEQHERAVAAESDLELGMQLIKRLERQVLEYQAQLADLAKQKPIGVVYHSQRCGFHVGWSDSTHMDAGMELFTRAAPAAMPVDLVPNEMFMSDAVSANLPTEWMDGFNACRAEMLRRIEGLK